MGALLKIENYHEGEPPEIACGVDDIRVLYFENGHCERVLVAAKSGKDTKPGE